MGVTQKQSNLADGRGKKTWHSEDEDKSMADRCKERKRGFDEEYDEYSGGQSWLESRKMAR